MWRKPAEAKLLPEPEACKDKIVKPKALVLAPHCGDFTRAPQLSLWETVRAFLENARNTKVKDRVGKGAPWRTQGAAGGGGARGLSQPRGPAGWAFSRQGCFFSHLCTCVQSLPTENWSCPSPAPPINCQKNNSREREEDERMFTERPLWE